MAKAIKKNSSKPKSSRRKTKSKSKTKKKKSSKRVNAYIISDESSSDSSDSENSTTSSENELETNTLAHSWNESGSDSSGTSESSNSESDSEEYEDNAIKKKITNSDTKRTKKRKSARPKTSSKKSSNAFSDKKSSKDTRPLKISTDNISLNAFFAILRSMVDSFTCTQPKEVSINGYNMINAEFIALKDPVLNHFTSNFSDKEREKFWHEITMIFFHILQPISDLIRIASQQTNIPPQTAPEGSQSEAEISWPNPIEINFIHKIIPNDVATIYCKISSPLGKIVQVPSAMIDSRANCSVISKGLIKLLGAEVDKNKKPSVKWRNNSLESSGISYNISVTVGQGENSCTISEDFLVMDDDKPWILLGTPWLDRAGWEPIVKREFKLMYKNKVITIPLSVHKSPSFLINSKRENLVNVSILPSSDLLREGGTLEKKTYKL
ncbi:hypothetical protein F8M41_018130 [Gigaspora margarita]|uniref:Uncharacterized protein n=1 Tax=Gigaspora margarita TaxID=4874 RepID=A0A8H4B2Q6_GIGMA|nr:hypothetical protein F8M41_018130 [Gigaspora margarita]